MSYLNWLNLLKSAQKESSIHGNSRRVFYKFPDGKQMSEEYNMETGVLERRAWRRCKQLMSEPIWELEVGELPRLRNTARNSTEDEIPELLFTESNSTPLLSKRITKHNIEYRIRNLPYPLSVYDVRADADKRKIIVSTKNKKYYKVLSIEELERCGLAPEQSNIFLHHQYETLIITYRKPEIVKEMEAQVLVMLKDVPTNENNIGEMLKQIVGQQ